MSGLIKRSLIRCARSEDLIDDDPPIDDEHDPSR